MTLRSLQSQERKLAKEWRKVRDNIEKITLPKRLKEQKTRYEGKCFVYQNSYSSSESWSMYVKCIEVLGDRRYLVEQFQITTHKNHEFEVYEMFGESAFVKEISHTAYNNARSIFWAKVDDFKPGDNTSKQKTTTNNQ